MKILSVVGARPQFIKSAAVSRAFREHNALAGGQDSGRVREILVHTGQHFDRNMSRIFFEQLDIPRPDYNLGVHSLNHGAMTGRMLEKIEEVLIARRPDWVLVYGDTNSTIAGALAAAKLHIPTAHVEAGLRSFNRLMPEEVNRILADHASSLLFCPTARGAANLAREGFGQCLDVSGPQGLQELDRRPDLPIQRSRPLVMNVGDVMYDAALLYAEKSRRHSRILEEQGLTPGGFILATIHRAENTDQPQRLRSIMEAFFALSESRPLALPLHPRTRRVLADLNLLQRASEKLRLMEPVGYLDMVSLELNAGLVITDSGGVQKEAYFFRTPCITVRDQTEWVELVEMGHNVLTGPDAGEIVRAAQKSFGAFDSDQDQAAPFGDGRAGRKICRALLKAKVARG